VDVPSYVAHLYLGSGFGTIYDLSTMQFCGLQVHRRWQDFSISSLICHATVWHPTGHGQRGLIGLYGVAAVTILFKADVEAQGGAYATGVLVLMSSAAFAVTLLAHHRRSKRTLAFGIITLVFLYTSQYH